jgi:hypothetical protein
MEARAVPPDVPTTANVYGLAQLILAEKRTSLAVLRTGITVAILPLSVTTVLVTLSKFYIWVENLQFLVPMYAVLTGLMVLSVYLITRATLAIRRQDAMMEKLCAEHPEMCRFMAQ